MDSKIKTRDGSEDLLQVLPFNTNYTDNELLKIFKQSINSVNEEENILFSDLVSQANDFSIQDGMDGADVSLPEKYQNLKLVVDKKTKKIRVPNLFMVGLH